MWILALSLFFTFSFAQDPVWFRLDGSQTRCLTEYVLEGKLILGEWSTSPPRQKNERGIKMTVSDTLEKTVYDKTVDNGKFAYENPTAGEYLFCFQNMDRVERTIQFKVTVGVHAQDYSELATTNNLEPLERELQRLLDTVKDTMHNLELSREIQTNIHQTNSSTHRRTLWFGLLTIGVLIGLNFWQTFYLKSFFKKMKKI